MRPGWKIKTIGEVCEIYNGGTPSTSIPEYWDGGIQWITPKDMGKSKEMYVSRCERTISQEGVEHSSTKVLPERSVIVSSRAPIGYVAINDVPMATNQGCKGFVLGKELYPEFLYYFLLASTELLNKLGTGATFKEVSGKKLAGIEVPVPSIQEQQRIVDILDQEFAKIDALKANAEKSLQAAKDLFQATLKKELEPKEGWKTTTLGQSLKLTSGDNLTAKNLIPGPFPVYGGNGVMGYHNQYNLDGQNLIVGRVGALCGNVRLVKGKIWYTDNAFLVHDKQSAFFLPFLALILTNANLRQYATQAAQPVVSNASMKDVRLSFPEAIEEQRRIASIFDNLNDRCKSLQDNYQKTLVLCEDLKQSLLRKAFNGEL